MSAGSAPLDIAGMTAAREAASWNGSARHPDTEPPWEPAELRAASGTTDRRDPRQQRRPADFDAAGIAPIDWPVLWALDPPGEEWAIPQILPRGRECAIFGSAGVGKSLVMLDVASAKATGRSALGEPPTDPVSVVYIDAEMTAGDLQERLADLGYGPDDDLSHLHYYQLQNLPPLDTPDGRDISTPASETSFNSPVT